MMRPLTSMQSPLKTILKDSDTDVTKSYSVLRVFMRTVTGQLMSLVIVSFMTSSVGCRSEHREGSQLSESNQRFLAAQASLSEGAIYDAERQYHLALAADFDNVKARVGLMELLRVQGRNRQIREHLNVLVHQGQCPSAALFAVAWPEKHWIDSSDAAMIRVLLSDPVERRWRSLFFHSSGNSNHSDTHILTEVVEQGLLNGVIDSAYHGFLGVALVNSGLWDLIPRWNSQLPESADSDTDPNVWYVKGLWCLQKKDSAGALRCFAESISGDSDHAGALYQLMLLLPQTEFLELAGTLSFRHQQVVKLKALVVDSESEGIFPSVDRIEKISKHLESMGRLTEAIGWQQLVRKNGQNSDSAANRIATLNAEIRKGSSFVSLHENLDPLRRIPVPVISLLDGKGETVDLRKIIPRISFRDDASEVGLHFQFAGYRSAAAPRMYEISAGGVAAVDIDSDDWPDLWFSQGITPGYSSDEREATDVLYRNIRGKSFERVDQIAGLDDSDYGQGVAVGDVNGDGFSDVYVCNIGRDKLFLSNGDGTFSACVDLHSAHQAGWSMSAAMCDLNGDTFPEIYVVHYLNGDAIARSCNSHGRPVQCRPTLFAGEVDEVILNQGDGSFCKVSPDADSMGMIGKGMGIIAGRLIPETGNSIFVANDTTPNRLMQFQTSGEDESIMTESRFRGVEFGDDGLPLAGMGIAAGDVNQDGLLDLFVTNFVGQPNSLFIQQQDGFFLDQTRTHGLREISVQSMGWGTQFLDADLDMDLDLFISNGHLEDYSKLGIRSAMKGEMFRNNGSDGFLLCEESEAGAYFSKSNYGRAVAKLDWNGDQREDLCVTHAGSPAALLTNLSEAVGMGVSLKLIGQQSERIPTGAMVEVISSGKTSYYFLVSGSGFQASNENRMVVSLPGSGTHFSLVVHWPNRSIQRFDDIPVHGRFVIREDRPELLVLPD